MTTCRSLGLMSLAVFLTCAVSAQSTPPQMTPEEYDALFAKVNNAAQWGKDDARGTLNTITAQMRAAAAREVRTGETISLSRPLEAGNVPGALEPAQVTGLDLTDGDIHWLAERVTVIFHGYAFSHLDAPSHAAFRGRAYNGVSDTPADRARLGIEHAEDGLVSRGVLVDLPALRGVEYLEPGTAYTPADMEAWEKKASVTIGRGDVVLIRTGRWMRQKAQGPVDATKQLAGPHPTMAAWLHGRGVAVVGDDGANDLAPSIVPGVSHPFHMLALVAMGMPLLDNQDLDRLSAACAASKRWTFLFVASPLRIANGTGSPVNALAIF
jgi:kynurenine formamidase